ncbi:hypothetical protein FH505_10925 [Bacillus velezensis]|uniref:hypothetical protein n=1 Tax=Bacillus velezensis TaxID=492670 RepID=UPI001122DC0A|nr:hypothetical protein [Bacillus velezensis]TNU64306.1 hypothetical protein FH505_10925 [Bacillus velezensis]
MNSFETYKKRLLAYGSTPDEVIINNTKDTINKSFDSSLFSESIPINGELTDVIINQGKTSEDKTLLFRPDYESHKGAIAEINDSPFLITEFDTNRLYPIAKAKLCNSSISLTSSDRKIPSGKINEITGKPIMITVPGEKLEIPCVFERTTSIIGSELAINIPEGQAHVTIPFLKHEKLKKGLFLSFYGEEFRVDDIDYSKVYGDSGTLRLIAKKKVGGDSE